MKSSKHVLWVEKYRPHTLSEYVFHDDSHRKAFKQMVENKTIPHLLLSGVQGSGKTTISQVLINELDLDPTDVLTINASDENSVDTMRDKIKSFISTYAMGDFKIVHLEEADYISPNGQAILRRFMEDFHDSARFILTCNYANKILPAIKSRSQEFRFKAADTDEITEFVAKILISENVKIDIALLDKYVAVGYPDIRKIINMLQQNVIDNVLQPLTAKTEAGDYKFRLLDMIAVDNWQGARELACANVATEEWEDVYRFLYENLHKSKKFRIDLTCLTFTC